MSPLARIVEALLFLAPEPVAVEELADAAQAEEQQVRAALRELAGVPRAGRILQRNVYGWFVRLERGTYTLTEAGGLALSRFADALPPASLSA
jgi:hypothetical protein